VELLLDSRGHVYRRHLRLPLARSTSDRPPRETGRAATRAGIDCWSARGDGGSLDPRFGGLRLREMPLPPPVRVGERPRTTPTNPHTQLDQQPTDLRWVEELAERVFALPGVVEEPSRISVPGARALVLAPGEAAGPPEAFLIDLRASPSRSRSQPARDAAHPGGDRGRGCRLGRAPSRRHQRPDPRRR
jgi:hypothetical protein